MSKTPFALLVNDIHISKDKISEFLTNWNEMLQVCDDNGIQELIIGGDLWQSRSAQDLSTLMAVRQAILKTTKDVGINLTIAAGNHCKVDQESVLSYSHIFSDYEYVDIVDDYIAIELDPNTMLYVMSYFPENGSFTEKLQSITSSLEKQANILYCHEGIRGGLATPSDDELPAHIFQAFDKVLVGHYHNRKAVAGTNIEYIGSSRQHNFGEDEEKGYTILYTDGSTKFIKNEANIRYRVIDIDLADMDNDFMDNLQRIKADGRYKIKVRINCDSKQAKNVDKQKLVDNGAAKVELVTEQTEIHVSEAQDISKKFDKTGIKEEYTTFCSQRSIENVELGLQYLDKIN